MSEASTLYRPYIPQKRATDTDKVHLPGDKVRLIRIVSKKVLTAKVRLIRIRKTKVTPRLKYRIHWSYTTINRSHDDFQLAFQ